MKGVTNAVINDLKDINHLVIVLGDLTTDKRMSGLIKQIKGIVGGYVNE